MFALIRKYPSLTTVFILLVVASFVIFYTDRAHLGFGGDKTDFGSIQGKPITSRQYIEAHNEALLTHFFRYQDWPRAGSASAMMGWDTERQATERIFMVNRLKELNIEIGDEAVARQVAQIFRNAQGVRVEDAYKNFLEKNLRPQGLTDEDFRRFLRHELGIQQLGAVVSASGRLITPVAAEAMYRQKNEQVDTVAVFFAASNYVAQAKANIDPKALVQYYSNLVQNYNLPERMQVAYVEFDHINFLAEAGKELLKMPDLAKQIDATYLKNGAVSYKDEKGEVLPADKAKEMIRDDARKMLAKQLARKQAYEFASELQEMKPLSSKNLKVLADKKNMKVVETEPFTKLDGPKGINEYRDFASVAFELKPQAPFVEEPVQAEGVWYVLGYVNRLPSQAQPFETVKTKVEQDYVKNRSRELAIEAGKAFSASVKGGKKFAELAKEKKLNLVDIPPFSRVARSIPAVEAINVSSFQYRGTATSLKVGEVSSFVSAGDGGFVLQLEKILPADEENMKKDMKDFIEEARAEQANTVFNEWVSTQLQTANFVSPTSSRKK